MSRSGEKDHYIPVGYLKNWKKEAGQLFVYDIKERKQFERGPKGIAHEPRFHGSIETKIRDNIENPAFDALRRIKEKEEIQQDTLDRILLLMALIILCNPRDRRKRQKTIHGVERIQKDLQQALDLKNPEVPIEKKIRILKERSKYVELTIAEQNPEATQKEVEEKLKVVEEAEESEKRTINVTESLSMEILNIKKIHEILRKRSWILLKTEENLPEFITCDHPVSLSPIYDISETEGPIYIGYKSANTYVTFPLNPRQAIYGTFQRLEESEITIEANEKGERVVAEINGDIWSSAIRQVYGKSPFLQQSPNNHQDQSKP